jgi:hypothetical protein
LTFARKFTCTNVHSSMQETSRHHKYQSNPLFREPNDTRPFVNRPFSSLPTRRLRSNGPISCCRSAFGTLATARGLIALAPNQAHQIPSQGNDPIKCSFQKIYEIMNVSSDEIGCVRRWATATSDAVANISIPRGNAYVEITQKMTPTFNICGSKYHCRILPFS